VRDWLHVVSDFSHSLFLSLSLCPHREVSPEGASSFFLSFFFSFCGRAGRDYLLIDVPSPRGDDVRPQSGGEVTAVRGLSSADAARVIARRKSVFPLDSAFIL